MFPALFDTWYRHRGFLRLAPDSFERRFANLASALVRFVSGLCDTQYRHQAFCDLHQTLCDLCVANLASALVRFVSGPLRYAVSASSFLRFAPDSCER
jgi:hypothetical protein